MKYTLEFKLECVEKYKKGIRIDLPPGVKHRATFSHYLMGWVKAYEDLGVEGLMHKSRNREWTPEERLALVAKVLAGSSMREVARSGHIAYGMLYQWVKRYRERGMDGLECRRGKPPKVPIMPKKKAKLTPSEREELEFLRARNEYLEAENEYLKKLDALVAEREAARPKARKRKSSKR